MTDVVFRSPKKRGRLAVFLSGRGSNFLAIHDAVRAGKIGAEISLVLSNKEEAPGLLAARERGLFIGAVHGLGLYQGVELVRHLTSLEPATEETLALCDRALDLGVIMQPTGENFNILKVKPPMCLTMESADHFVDAVRHALATGW